MAQARAEHVGEVVARGPVHDRGIHGEPVAGVRVLRQPTCVLLGIGARDERGARDLRILAGFDERGHVGGPNAARRDDAGYAAIRSAISSVSARC